MLIKRLVMALNIRYECLFELLLALRHSSGSEVVIAA